MALELARPPLTRKWFSPPERPKTREPAHTAGSATERCDGAASNPSIGARRDYID